MIAAKSISKSYGHLKVLDRLDLDVAKGEAIAVLGRNGSGKTTLLKLLAGVLRPDEGTVEIDGLKPREARSRIGFAGHDPYLYPHLTVEENLRFFARMYGVSGMDVDAAIERTGLEARRNALAGTLSRGETQRSSLARATLHDPDVLIADEPTTGLDEDAVDRLHSVLGIGVRSVVIATHDLERGPWENVRKARIHEGRLHEVDG